MVSTLRHGLLGLFFGTAAVVIACGSDGDSTFDGGPGGSSSDGTSGQPGPFGPQEDSGNNSSGSNGGDGALNECATLRDPAQRLPADLFFMVDTSGSMQQQATAGNSKWSAVKAALDSFVSSADSNGIGVALDYFPHRENNRPQSCSASSECNGEECARKWCKNKNTLVPTLCDTDADCQGAAGDCVPLGVCQNDQFLRCGLPRSYCENAGTLVKCGNIGQPCTDPGGSNLDGNGFPLGNCIAPTKSTCGVFPSDSCVNADYETPEVPLAALPGNAAAIKSKLATFFPNGSTPTHASLSGALKAATTYKATHQNHVVAVVYATDGHPQGCDPTDAPTISGVAGTAFTTSKVQTFVIGVATPSEKPQLQPMLDAIADKGGTKKPFMVTSGASTSQDFLNALNTIRAAAFTCIYELPKPEAGIPDYNKVNVEYEAGNGTKTFQQYVKSIDKCSATTGGWYYDVDPAAGTPSKVILCETTCAKLKADPNGKINIVQGCVTNTDPPITK